MIYLLKLCFLFKEKAAASTPNDVDPKKELSFTEKVCAYFLFFIFFFLNFKTQQ
jgi:hypothetical protein